MNIIDYSLLVGIHKRDIFQTEQEQEELVTKLMVNKVCRYLDCYPIDDPCEESSHSSPYGRKQREIHWGNIDCSNH